MDCLGNQVLRRILTTPQTKKIIAIAIAKTGKLNSELTLYHSPIDKVKLKY
jgi:hypothetical protein